MLTTVPITIPQTHCNIDIRDSTVTLDSDEILLCTFESIILSKLSSNIYIINKNSIPILLFNIPNNKIQNPVNNGFIYKRIL